MSVVHTAEQQDSVSTEYIIIILTSDLWFVTAWRSFQDWYQQFAADNFNRLSLIQPQDF